MAKVEVNRYACKFQLLQHGLITEMYDLDILGDGKKTRTKEDKEEGEDLEEEEHDADTLIEKQNAFVREKIKKSKESFRGQRTTEHITIVTRERRLLLREFMRAIGGSGKCNNCRG